MIITVSLLDFFSTSKDRYTGVNIHLQLSAGRYKMAPNYGSVLKEALVLLNKFKAGRQCLDDFIEDASKDLQVGRLSSVSW